MKRRNNVSLQQIPQKSRIHRILDVLGEITHITFEGSTIYYVYYNEPIILQDLGMTIHTMSYQLTDYYNLTPTDIYYSLEQDEEHYYDELDLDFHSHFEYFPIEIQEDIIKKLENRI